MASLDVLNFITITCAKYNVDAKLAKAIAKTESGFDIWTMRYEPNYKWLSEPEKHSGRLGITLDTEIQLQKFSYGVFQIMGANARDLGYLDHLTKLLSVEDNVTYGVIFIKSLMNKYKDPQKVISSYNAGTPRMDAGGLFSNQKYVDTVLNNMKGIV